MPRNLASAISNPKIRKALMRLPPPNEDMLLDAATLKASREFDRAFSRGEKNAGRIQKTLNALTRQAQPLPVLDFTGSSFINVKSVVSLTNILSGLYLPIDTPDAFVPPVRRYGMPQTVTSTVDGSASANANSGNLISIQSVNLSVGSESAWAGFYVMFPTTVAKHGQLCRVSVDAELDWMARHPFDANPVWNNRLDGTVFLRSNVWIDAWEINPASGTFVPVVAPSARKFEVMYSTWYIASGGGLFANSGSLINGAASFDFLATPPRTYVIGVLTESRASHNIRNVDGGPIPQPGPGDLVTYSLTKASVPQVWVTYETLK